MADLSWIMVDEIKVSKHVPSDFFPYFRDEDSY
jgi:hypothetical protein